MNEDDIGKVFLLALPWDWTVVGRVAGFIGDRVVLHEAGYFTRTGATFCDHLCIDGFTAETQFHASKAPNGEIRVPNAGMVFLWTADWPQRPAARGRR